jgi:tRNA dimethylallyltransferase
LTAAPPLLNRRIEARVEAMFRAGLVEEVRGLLARYPELSPTARQAIGYAEAMDLLAGRCSLEQAVQQTTVRTRQLAKRQRTWFRHQAQVEWIEIGAGGDTAGAAARVMEHWSKHGPTAISG